MVHPASCQKHQRHNGPLIQAEPKLIHKAIRWPQTTNRPIEQHIRLLRRPFNMKRSSSSLPPERPQRTSQKTDGNVGFSASIVPGTSCGSRMFLHSHGIAQHIQKKGQQGAGHRPDTAYPRTLSLSALAVLTLPTVHHHAEPSRQRRRPHNTGRRYPVY